MSKMKMLDLFCCCGGISEGIKRALPDAEITGVDITDNHNYRFNFIHADVLKLRQPFLKTFDFIHASPPCQHYFYGINQENRNKFPDLVAKTRNLLKKVGKPFTIENIPNSPLRQDLILCGEMFGLRVIRHRIFELSGVIIQQPKHNSHRKPIDKTHSYYMQVAGHGGNSNSFKTDAWQKAMGIDWVSDKKHLTQMIPPIYSEFIARFGQLRK